MRKRSKYRPKDRLLNPIGFVVENSKGLAEQHNDYLTELKIKTHAAMLSLTRGEATKLDMNDLIQSYNVMDAFRLLGVKGVEQEIKAAGDSIKSIAERAKIHGKYLATGLEIKTLNDFLAYHDELMEHVTMKQFSDAVQLARKIIVGGKAYKLTESKCGEVA
jgi:hypothetical protein